MNSQTLALSSAIVGLIGSVILAFSLDRVLSEVGIAISALSTSIETIASTNDVYVFTGLDERLRSAGHISRWWVRAGIAMLVLSTALAVWSLRAASKEEHADHDGECSCWVRDWSL
jgi:hypothetical protein